MGGSFKFSKQWKSRYWKVKRYYNTISKKWTFNFYTTVWCYMHIAADCRNLTTQSCVSFFLFQSSHVTALFSCAKMASVFLKVMCVIIKKIVVMVLMRKAATLMNVSVRKLVAALKIVRIFLLDTRWISIKYGVRKCKFLILTCFLTIAWLL